MTRLTQQELQQSLLSSRQNMPVIVASAQAPQFQLQSLSRAQTDSGLAQAWRVTLSRLERIDNAAAAAPGDAGSSVPIYIAAAYQYYAWLQQTPVLPPRRAQPVYGSLDPNNAAGLDANFVEIAWGQGGKDGSGRPNRLVAHWPAQGASIVVVGSYVEVWGAGRVTSLGSPAIVPGSWPSFQASIVQDPSVHTEAGAELSLTESIAVQNALVSAFMFTDGVAHPGTPPGFGMTLDQGSSPPTGALRGSAVLNLAPFHGWNAKYAPAVGGRTPTLTVFVQSSGLFPNVAVTNNAKINNAGVVTASQGDVAVAIDTAAAPQLTFALLEAAITAAAASNLTLVTPSPNPGNFITDATVGSFSTNAVYNPPALAALGTAVMAPSTQGAVVYVPDFARRVRVVLTTLLVSPAGEGRRIPITGDPPCVLVFYDDRGNPIDEVFQGRTGGGSTGIVYPDFRAVPAAAVLMGIYPDAADATQYQALIHWRIAP